jgi:hypothetical protein
MAVVIAVMTRVSLSLAKICISNTGKEVCEINIYIQKICVLQTGAPLSMAVYKL